MPVAGVGQTGLMHDGHTSQQLKRTASLSRRRVVFLACAAAALAVAVSIATLVCLARKLALDEESADLAQLDRRVIERTNLAYRSAIDGLLDLKTSTLPRCSEAQIAAMRQATANNRYLTGMGVFDSGYLQCSAWGRSDARIPVSEPDFVTRDGIKVKLNLRPQVSGSGPRIALSLGDYFVLLDPAALLDSITAPTNRFAVATEDGHILATHNDPDPELLRSLIANPGSGMDDQSIYATVRERGFIAVAMKPRQNMLASFRKQIVFILPLFVLVVSLIVGTAVWMTKRRLSPLGELKAATPRREFSVHYQPIIELRTTRCIGAEALLRWRREDGSYTPPSEFIALAEQSGLILPITDQVIDCIISDLQPLLEADPLCHVTINLSAIDVRTGRFLDVMQKKLAPTNIRSSQIWLEVTESSFIEIEAASATLRRANTLGHPVAIDDFGTGYSSLLSLQDLPLDVLKIDKSFIETIGRESGHGFVVPWIIEMTRKLDLDSIAEGIEAREQIDYLIEQGVAYGQGWLFSKPLPASEFIAFYHRNKTGLPSQPH